MLQKYRINKKEHKEKQTRKQTNKQNGSKEQKKKERNVNVLKHLLFVLV
jgi:hypothetical protein